MGACQQAPGSSQTWLAGGTEGTPAFEARPLLLASLCCVLPLDVPSVSVGRDLFVFFMEAAFRRAAQTPAVKSLAWAQLLSRLAVTTRGLA